uniref:Uncharacterized protein n=1 Tax=Lepeophtheirus salmonis TaxID=72036 RepID=A0A0K2SZ49_LEPSM
MPSSQHLPKRCSHGIWHQGCKGAKIVKKEFKITQKTHSKESCNGGDGVLSLLVSKLVSSLSQCSFHPLFHGFLKSLL